MSNLPRIRDLTASSSGSGFFLCARKDVRTGRTGSEYLELVLQDVSGEIKAKVFQEVDTLKGEFEAGEFVKVQGRGNQFNQRLELIVDKIRRIIPDRDEKDGFREEDTIPCSPRPLDEMWAELDAQIASVQDPHVAALLRLMVDRYGDRLRIWPAAQTVHHAYRGGLLEHILQIMRVVTVLAEAYNARRDLVLAGALLHDIGKLRELSYETATEYSLEGNLVGHIAIGAGMVRDATREIPDFPETLRLEIEHLILSHHGARELGSPVEPITVEAFILSAIDDLDATIHQVRKHVADDTSAGPFTLYHRRLDRVLLK